MRFKKSLFVLAIMVVASGVSIAQDKSLGAIKGKVRVETGTPAGVTVVVRRGETEVTRSTTNKDGDFLVSKLTPGSLRSHVSQGGIECRDDRGCRGQSREDAVARRSAGADD